MSDPESRGNARTLLNVGCGSTFDPAWTNVDCSPAHPGIQKVDIRHGLPFSPNCFAAVYASHVLEHLTLEHGGEFLAECRRVLRPNGVIRLAVPDLEGIAKLYLESLELARRGGSEWKHRYDWMMLEMFDQSVREQSGGRMAPYIQRQPLTIEEFIIARVGEEARRIIHSARDPVSSPQRQAGSIASWLSRSRKLLSGSWWREKTLRYLLGTEYRALEIGRFRLSGEVHHWMYDSYSLGQLLSDAGFHETAVCSALESRIPEWKSFRLDTDEEKMVRKPDSLFMEAVKPS
jgi:predicted SAM-dependent methyltransferase